MTPGTRLRLTDARPACWWFGPHTTLRYARLLRVDPPADVAEPLNLLVAVEAGRGIGRSWNAFVNIKHVEMI